MCEAAAGGAGAMVCAEACWRPCCGGTACVVVASLCLVDEKGPIALDVVGAGPAESAVGTAGSLAAAGLPSPEVLLGKGVLGTGMLL